MNRKQKQPTLEHERDGVIISVVDSVGIVRCLDEHRPRFVTTKTRELPASTRVRLRIYANDQSRGSIVEVGR